jgi:hypothetical protein
VETKPISSETKFHLDKSKGKVKLDVFFDLESLVHLKFISEGHNVKKEMHVEILMDAVKSKHQEKLNS